MNNEFGTAVELFSQLSTEAQDGIITMLEGIVGEAKTPDYALD